MIIKGFEVRAHAAPWRTGIEFLAMCDGAFGRPLLMDTPVNQGISIEPTFSLSVEAAQILMDDLWQAGIRPTEGAGSAGAMAAVKYHLEDMRKLVFEKEK